ncbi:hypothetical protein ACHAO1_008479 [Botrytis cinerea]
MRSFGVHAANRSSVQCSTLAAILPTKISYPDSPTYIASIGSYFWQQEELLAPACIVTPTDTVDVSIIIAALTAIHAVDARQSLFSLRSGGHGTVVGAANNDGGVTIDLSSLDAISLNDARTIVSLGPGTRWQNVYAELDEFNLTVSGGRVAGIGVGGYLTGGGISFFSPAYGWACDQITGIEVVLAGGVVVYASPNLHPDLFSALLGGSNNFGVVTRFDIKTFYLGNMLGGLIVYPISTLNAQLQALMTFMEPGNFDSNATIIQAYVWSETEGQLISNDMEYSLPQLNPLALQPFMDIQPQYANTERIGTLLEFVMEQATFEPNDASLWNQTIPVVSGIAGLQYSLIFQRLPVTIHGSLNPFGLPLDADSLLLCQLSLSWTNIDDDQIVIDTVDDLITSIEEATKAASLFNPFKYINYAASFQDPFAGYGPANKAKLMAASKKYDSSKLFQEAVPGGFKLF